MLKNQYAILKQSLKGFEEPDTSSQVEGTIPSGTYLVLEYKENFPTQDTDYIHIEVPALGDEETWICSRWKDSEYATIESRQVQAAVPIDFGTDVMTIEENALVSLLPDFYDFEYDLDRARYPYPITGFKAPIAPPQTNNCCTFVEGLVVKAWENAIDGFEWSRARHGQMMIFSADDFFSPVTALVESGIAEPVTDDDQSPHKWTVVQGWRKQWSGGHTFIILDHDPVTDKVMTLESNSAYKLNGVGYRMVGNVKDFNAPPENWQQLDNLWTWERIKSTYRYRKQCILKLKDISWA